MKKRQDTPRAKQVRELEPHNRRKVDFAKFRPDLTPKEVTALLPGAVERLTALTRFVRNIETLGVAKTVGKGRTNLTFVEPTLVQADATVPHAAFDRAVSPHRNPAIQMHFLPAAYGITTISSYLMVFTIETVGSCTFSLGGLFGRLSNPGTRVINGQATVTLVFRNVTPNDNLFGFLEQTAGGRWIFFSVSAQFPPIVLTQI